MNFIWLSNDDFLFHCLSVGILGLDRFSPSPSFTYSLNYLYQYRFMDSYFIQWLWSITIIILMLSFSELASCNLYPLLSSLFDSVYIILWTLPYFLWQKDNPNPYCIFFTQVLESVVYLRVLVPFSGEWYWKPKSAFSGTHYYWVSLLP